MRIPWHFVVSSWGLAAWNIEGDYLGLFFDRRTKDDTGACRQIAKEKIRPVRAKLDEDEEFPWDIMKILAQADLFGLYIPEQYGGMGGGIFEKLPGG